MESDSGRIDRPSPREAASTRKQRSSAYVAQPLVACWRMAAADTETLLVLSSLIGEIQGADHPYWASVAVTDHAADAMLTSGTASQITRCGRPSKTGTNFGRGMRQRLLTRSAMPPPNGPLRGR
jgi:hypothetical protein